MCVRTRVCVCVCTPYTGKCISQTVKLSPSNIYKHTHTHTHTHTHIYIYIYIYIYVLTRRITMMNAFAPNQNGIFI